MSQDTADVSADDPADAVQGEPGANPARAADQAADDAAVRASSSESADAVDTGSSESMLTILLALAANVGVGLLKLAAGLITGSSALLSEAAHSAGDSTTELLLLVAARRSTQPADRAHPFGYGKERYFWSMLASLAILASGAGFSFYQGFKTIFGHDEPPNMLWINYPVLVVAALLEGISLRQAVKQMRSETARTKRTLINYLRIPRDPTVNSVLLEDSAAIVGLAIAAAGVGLHQLTGSPVWDGLASVGIGALLLVVAFVLARACKTLLIGQQADVRLLRAIEAFLEQQPEIDDVVDVLSMLTGVDSVLLCLRVDFADGMNSDGLEEACARLDAALRAKFTMLAEVFIQPASRRDIGFRTRVEQRYGRALADE